MLWWLAVCTCLCACIQAEMKAARMVLSEEARDQALMQLLCCYA